MDDVIFFFKFKTSSKIWENTDKSLSSYSSTTLVVRAPEEC